MVRLTAFLPAKWGQFLKQLADDHEVDRSIAFDEKKQQSWSNNWIDRA